MPFYPPIDPSLTFEPATLPDGFTENPEQNAGPRPSFGDTLGAGFAIDNEIAGAIKGLDRENNFGDVDRDHNPWEQIQGTELEPYGDAFLGSRNQKNTDYIASAIREELRNRKILEASHPLTAFAASGIASLASPTTLLPGGVIYRGLKVGRAAAKSAAAVGAANAAAAGIQEGILHSQQYARTSAESAFAVGGSFLLAGILGGAASGMSSRAFQKLTTKLETDLRIGPAIDAEMAAMARGESVGAASVAKPPADLKSAFGLEKLDVLGPSGRGMNSDFPSMREMTAELAELPTMLTRNAEGITTAPRGGSIETRIKTQGEARLGEAVSIADNAWKEYRFGTQKPSMSERIGAIGKSPAGKLSEKEFRQEIGKALVRNDTHAISEIQKAAREIRKAVIQPIAEDAIKLKKLDLVEVTKNLPNWLKNEMKPQPASGGADIDPMLRSNIDGMLSRVEEMTGQKIAPEQRNQALAAVAGNEDLLRRLREVFTGEQDIPFAIRDGLVGRTTDDMVFDLEDGRPVALDRKLTDRIESVVRDVRNSMPEHVRSIPVHVMVGAEPTTSGVSVSFRGLDGTFRQIDMTLEQFRRARAFSVDGQVFLTRADLVGDFSKAIGGEIWHETVHALRFQGRVDSLVLDRLGSHSQSLGVLDMTARDFLRLIDDPYADAAPSVSLRELYQTAYAWAKDTPGLLDRLIQEEAVAHMVEMRAHGKLSDEQLGPVLADMDAAFGRPVPAGEARMRAVNEWVADLGGAIKADPDGGVRFALRDLDPSPEARKARAEEMGFDTSRVLYHGTAVPIDAFSKLHRGSVTGARSAKGATWLVESSDVASGYADLAATKPIADLIKKSERAERAGKWDDAHRFMAEAERLEQEGGSGQNILPVYVRGKLKEIDMDGMKYDPDDVDMSTILKEAKAEGYDGVRLTDFSDDATYGTYTPTSHVAVFDPRNIRSVNAMFDPTEAGSANLMFALRDLSRRLDAPLVDDLGKSDPHPGRVMALHGTRSQPFDQFDATMSRDFGIHFGTSSQADIPAGFTTTRENARMFPVVLDLKTVVDVPDLMVWPPTEVAEAVERAYPLAGGLTDRVRAAITNHGGVDVGPTGSTRPSREALAAGKDELRRLMTDANIDGLRYWNEAEGEGWSYIVWDQGKVTSATSGEPMMGVKPVPADDLPQIQSEAKASMQAAAENGVKLPDGTKIHGVPLFAIKAYHGTPHDFDRFSMDKIGTGEGAQVYGHGLYFAEREGVARSYRDALSGDNGYDLTKPNDAAWAYLEAAGGDRSSAIANLADHLSDRFWGPTKDQVSGMKSALDLLRTGAVINKVEPNPGYLYEVRINAEPEDFLDWDKPLSQQSENLMGALLSVYGDDPLKGGAIRNEYDGAKSYNGASLVAALGRNGREGATAALRKAGIPGIRYLDQGSRGAGEGSYNYVVFDDALIEIVAKNGKPLTKGQPQFAMRGDGDDILKKIRDLGGIKDETGDLRNMGAGERRGLINNETGLSPDVMREHLVQQGYLQDVQFDDVTKSSVNDLYDLIDNALRDDGGQGRAYRGEMAHHALRAVQDSLAKNGIEIKLTPDQEDAVVKMIIDQRMSVDDAAEAIGMPPRGDGGPDTGPKATADPMRDVHARRIMQEIDDLLDDGAGDGVFSQGVADEVWADGGESYGPRVWDRPRIIAQRPTVKAIISDYFGEAQGRAMGVLNRLMRDKRKIEAQAAASGKPPKLPADMVKDIDELAQFTSLSRQDLESTADQVIDHILGLQDGRMMTALPKSVRGSLRARTFHIPELFESASGRIEDFMDRDINVMMRQYVRSTVPDLEIIRRYGALDLQEQFARIGDDFKRMVDRLNLTEQQRAGMAPEAIAKHERMAERERKRLDKARRNAERDLVGMVSRLRGERMDHMDPTAITTRTLRGVRQWNLITMLGGMTVSALPDIFRPMMVHGVRSYFMDGLRPLMTSIGAVKKAGAEVKSFGTALDLELNTRLQAFADVVDDYGRYSKFERGLGYATEKFGIMSLMSGWNASLKRIAGMMSMTNIVRASQKVANGTASKADIERLAAANIDAFDARIIADQFGKHGAVEGGVFLPNTKAWDAADPNIRMALDSFKGAVVRDVDRTIVTPGQEKPLFMSTEVGATLMQFKTFGISSFQRTLVAGLQQRDSGVVLGALLSIGMGMVVEHIKALTNDKPLPKNEAQWIAAGLDRSGLLSYFSDVNNLVEKGSGGTLGIGALTGKELSRYASRNAMDALLGPSVGRGADIFAVTSGFSRALAGKDQVRESDIATFRRLIPYQNLFYLSYIFQKLEQAVSAGVGAKPSKHRSPLMDRLSSNDNWLDEIVGVA